MEKLPQLIMRAPDITNLPPLNLPDGTTVRTHRPGEEKEWEELIEAGFGYRFSFDFLIKLGGYKPEYLFYLEKNGRKIATATAVENPLYPGEGWFRMVAAHPEARGQGAGRSVCLAALYSLRERGYKSAVLSTDDHRIPAIRMYLSLGFEPVCSHESHRERWEAVYRKIEETRR